ncbi:MAG: YbjQ family protein [Alphaproteobacteria bacterium]|nr:YbjQ family protein [Alphaproteobacteria bacterium]
MIITTMEYVPGYKVVKSLGVAQGSTVRAKHVGRDIMARFKSFFGGELKGYTELLSESRDEAVERMVAQANAVGATAILNLRFATSSVASGAAELFAYGTAVVVEHEDTAADPTEGY